jgi:hypothetical protein
MNLKNIFGTGRGLISKWLGNNTEKKKANTGISRRKIGYIIVVLLLMLYVGIKVVKADPSFTAMAPSGSTATVPGQTTIPSTSATSAQATPTSGDTAQASTAHQKNLLDWLIEAGIKVAFTLFIYMTVIVTKIFILLLTFITTFVFLMFNFSDFTQYPSTYLPILNGVLGLVYVISFGLIFILFVQGMLNSLWRGEDPTKSIMGLVTGTILLFCIPLIYTYMFDIFNYIAQDMQGYASQSLSSATNSSNSIVGNLMQVSSFMGNTSQNGFTVTADLMTDQGSTAIGNAASSAVTDITTIAGIVGDRLENRDYPFFINQVLMFIISVVGILECFEVIILKAGQTLALIMAYFTGFFAASLATTESTRKTFWDWLKKTAQLFSYCFYWGLIIILINIFSNWMSLTNPFPAQTLNATMTSAWKALFFVCVLAGIKMMSKVGGIAEGFVMSSGVMQSFGQSVMRNLSMAGGIVKTAGEASVAGGAAVVGGGMLGSKAALGMANILQRKSNDPGTSLMDHFKDMKYESGQKQALNAGNISRPQAAANMTKLDNFSSQGQGGGSSLRTSTPTNPTNAGQGQGTSFKRPGGPQ